MMTDHSTHLHTASLGRIILLWLLWTIIVGICAAIFTSNGLISEQSNVLMYVAIDGILASLLLELKRNNLFSLQLIHNSQNPAWPYLLLVIPLILSSLGLIWLTSVGLHYTAPDLYRLYAEAMEESPLSDLTKGPLHIVFTFISICIVAPIAEEFIFRGIILEKLRRKYSTITGVIISSLIFGVLHLDVFGAFLFGVVLCLLYLQTNSLFLPIAIHALNNLAAFLLELIWPSEITASTYIEYLQTYQWLYIPSLFIGLSVLGWFIYQRRNVLTSAT